MSFFYGIIRRIILLVLCLQQGKSELLRLVWCCFTTHNVQQVKT